MTLNEWGALCFGVVVGWITYRTLRRSSNVGLSDIATVIAAVGGGAVTSLFPAGGRAFGAYGIGLAAGFAFYLIVSLLVAAATKGGIATAEVWLGTEPTGNGESAGRTRQQGSGVTEEPIPTFRR